MNPRFKSISFNAVIVNAYKLSGFVVLTMILLGLGGYIGSHLFYLVDNRWMAPTVLSPTDDKVLSLNTQLAEQILVRDELRSTHLELIARRNEAARLMELEESFQDGMRIALDSDIADRTVALNKLRRLAYEYGTAKTQIVRNTKSYSNRSSEMIASLGAAQLVSREDQLGEMHRLSQIAQSNLSINEKSVDIQGRAEGLAREIRGLVAAKSDIELSSRSKPTRMSSEELRLRREYTISRLNAEKSRDFLAAIDERIAATAAAIDRREQLIVSIQRSPYLLAVEKDVTVAFVPYSNIEEMEIGASIYVCHFGVIFCSEVGKITSLYEGEVNGRHPEYNHDERGVMIEIELTEKRWRVEPVMFAGRPPLFI